MRIYFEKYQGTGNDFIMIDGREKTVNFSVSEIQQICNRRFGVGADGLIIMRKHPTLDFEMDYYNADGSQSFCGNGSRCAQAFAKSLGQINGRSNFLAIDGEHEGKSVGANFATKMRAVDQVQEIGEDYFVYTGSPHYVKYVDDVDRIDVFTEGRKIRYAEPYKDEGTNVNFVSESDGYLKVRTYERGVEAETFSCGTGVTAVAISYLYKCKKEMESIDLLTKGGMLNVALKRKAKQKFDDIWLIGPAQKVFKGSYLLHKS